MDISLREKRLKILFFAAICILILIVLVLLFGFNKDDKIKNSNIGFIMVSDHTNPDLDKFQIESAKSICDGANIKFFIKSDVKENSKYCMEAVKELVNEGAEMIFIQSNYLPPLKNISRTYPNISFATNCQYYQSKNMSSYAVRMYQGRFLAGALAGLRTKSNVIGYVASISTPEVNLEINSFTLGVQHTNPNAKVVVAWTNAWKRPPREAENTRRLVKEAHADVITYHQEDHIVADVAEELNVEFIGYNALLKNYSPKHLTSIVCRWDVYYREVIQNYLRGELNYFYNNWLDINTGAVILTNYSDLVTPEMKMKIEVLRQQMINGKNIFSGLIYDNEGNIRCAADETISDYALLKRTNWLVKGVQILE